MAGVKSLFKDTAIYGTSSIIGRFLNWCLVPIYTNVFPVDEYGVVTYIYSYVALAMVILTYGMETGFFRFANHEDTRDPMRVYSTALLSLAGSSTLFSVVVLLFLYPIAGWLDCTAYPSFVWLMAITVAIDAFCCIPFSYLRFRARPYRFASLKLLNIGLNIGLNLFFIILCPWLMTVAPGSVDWFYDPGYGVGYIFLANFISSVVTLLTLLPELLGFRYIFDGALWSRMFRYSLPLLVLGVAGIMNQTLDKMLLPRIITDQSQAMYEVGIYGANYKVAIVMLMFIQAFRFAYEPFIFARGKAQGEDRLQSYRDAMKYFVVFSMAIFLIVTFYIDIMKHFIAPAYYSGLRVVPIIMLAEFFFGVFFNLSVWYKLTDRTVWGMYFSLLGLAITVALNFLLVPSMGYMGCAVAAISCYGVMMVASYAVGRRLYPIGYEVGRMSLYFFLALALYGVALLVNTGNEWLDMAIRTPLLVIYIAFAIKREGLHPLLMLKKR